MKHKRQNHKKPNASNQVRIVAGQFKRRNIGFIDADGLRPTPDRMRETLFSWLMHDIYDANVLDTCAGSGVLSFESLSRGANKVTLIEANPQQVNQLKKTADQLNLSSQQVTILNAKAEDAIGTISPQIFDIVFIDPPYSLDLWQPIVNTLLKNQLIDADTLIYIESNQPLETIFDEHTYQKMQIIKQKTTGQVFSWIIKLK